MNKPFTADNVGDIFLKMIKSDFASMSKMEQLVNQLNEIAAKHSEQSGWVKCSDRLPTKHMTVDVVVKNEYGQYRIPNSEFRIKDIWHKTDRFEHYQRTDEGMRWVDITNQVTHWMELPKLP